MSVKHIFQPARDPLAQKWRQVSVLLYVMGGLLLIALLMPSQAQNTESTIYARESAGFTADQLLDFGEQLMRDGEYFRAITEYRRFLFLYPNDSRRPMVHFRLGLALYRGESYAEALTTFREVTQQYPQSPYSQQAWLWQGESLMRQTHFEAAERIYRAISQQLPDHELGHLATYQAAWTLVYRRQWQAAADQFKRVQSPSPLQKPAQRLATEVLDGASLPHKSPLLAGILSGFLPGAGQLYNGRPGDALLAFLLNGLFVFGIVEALEHDEIAIAGVLGFFEAGWYTGNVYGAVNGAHKYNRHTTETFLRNLENRFYITPPEARSPTWGLQLVRFGF